MVYRPVAGSVQVTGDTASHAAYGVGPATDYAVGIGTPVYAPIDGVVDQWWSTTGGNTVVVDGDGWTGFGQHLSRYTTGDGARVAARAQIAASGNTGSSTTGPHLHWWMIRDDGERFSMEEFIGLMGGTPTPIEQFTPSGLSPAGGGSTTFPDDPLQEDETMTQFFGATAPAKIPDYYTPYNGGLAGGKLTYFIFEGGLFTVTQDGQYARDAVFRAYPAQPADASDLASNAFVGRVIGQTAWSTPDAQVRQALARAGSTVVNGDPAVTKLLEQLVAGQAALLAATKALNPPG